MSLLAIVRALGGDLYAGGRRANVPAPGHSAADRSVSLLLSDGRVVAHSFGGADWREVLDDLRRRSLIDATGSPTSGLHGGASPEPPLRSARLAAARALWAGGRAIAPASESERYLAYRRVNRLQPAADVLRHHACAPVSVYRPGQAVRPAMMAAVSDAAGAFTAVELTYLNGMGRRAVGLKLSRKTVGLIPQGSAVRLDPPGPELLVAEGVFTTLSATERFDLPGWALLSTRNLRSWCAPEGIRRVLIAADRGMDGLHSARVLAARLRRDGLSAAVRPPPRPYDDWNDWARAQEGDPGGGREGEAGRAGPEGWASPAGAGEPP